MRARPFATSAAITAAFLLTAVVLLAAVTGSAQGAGTPLAARLARSLAGPGLSSAHTSALAVDVRTGEVVFAHNPTLAVAPASNEKLCVAYAALVRLGPSYRFRTEVAGTGELVDGVWKGNLYLRGHGDPTLSRAGIESLAAQLVEWGIRRVRGAVLGDESWYDSARTAPGWRASFLGDESPPLSALTVDRARGWPALSSSLLGAVALEAALERRGIAVDRRPGRGVTPAAALPLAQELSPSLAEIVRTMNRESDNFVAELLLKELGAAAGTAGTTAAGARVVREALHEAAVPLGGIRIADGSGLSRLDRLSASTLVGLLLAAERDGAIRDAFVSSLAVAGVSGTLEDRLDRRPTYGRVVAKTGTTRVASSLSGFVRGRYVFAVLQNGAPVATWAARAAQDRFVTTLASS